MIGSMSNHEIKDLPSGWVQTTLGSIVTSRKGKKPRTLFENGNENFLPYIDIAAFERGRITRYGPAHEGVECSNQDILIVWDGARCGLVGKADKGLVGSTIMCLTPRSVEPEYLMRFLQLKYDELNSKSRGTGIPHLDPTFIWSLNVPVAPLHEQRRIVAKVEALFAESKTVREALDKVPVLLRRFRQSVLVKAFRGELIRQTHSEQPCPKPLNEIALIFNGKAVGSGNSQIRVFKTRHVYPSGLKMDNPSYLRTEQEAKISPEKLIRSGDVLIVNTWQNLGRVCYVEKSESNWTIDSQIMVVRAKERNIGKYIFYFLSSERGYELLLGCERGALTAGKSRKLTHIYPKHVGNIQIPYLPPDQQSLAVAQIDTALVCALTVENQVVAAKTKTELLEHSILAKAFRGELVPQDPNEEPASVLLQRAL